MFEICKILKHNTKTLSDTFSRNNYIGFYYIGSYILYIIYITHSTNNLSIV